MKCNKRVSYYKHHTGLCALDTHPESVEHLVEMVSIPMENNPYHNIEDRTRIVIDYAELTNDELLELVVRRRRQLHVHSVAYYHLDKSYVDDVTYDLWSKELVDIYAAFPALRTQGDKSELFLDWSGETGMHLNPSDDTLRVLNSLRKRRTHEG